MIVLIYIETYTKSITFITAVYYSRNRYGRNRPL